MIRKWCRFPSESVEFSSLEIPEKNNYIQVCNQLWVTLLEQKVGAEISRDPSQIQLLCDSVNPLKHGKLSILNVLLSQIKA